MLVGCIKYFHTSEGNWPISNISSEPHGPQGEGKGLGIEAVQGRCSDIRVLSPGSQERNCLLISPQGGRKTKIQMCQKAVGYGLW